MGFLDKIGEEVRQGLISQHMGEMLQDFYHSYANAVQKNGYRIADLEPLLNTYVSLVRQQLAQPYDFGVYHERLTAPFDYYNFGLEILRPLIDFPLSTVCGLDNVCDMEAALARGENVILLSNHQIEPDPQAISLLLQMTHPQIAANMIFVAGHRVTSDPIAVPFSKGVNLLCIFSKNYIETPPEQKHDKLMHNRRAMQKLVELLSQGGKCIYVAPSGGRDRPDGAGVIQVAPFDPNSIEMFRLMAQQSGSKVHFHTLALATHDLQPPPNAVEMQLGEKRGVHATPIHLAFGPEIDMEACVDTSMDKNKKRQVRADYIWKRVACDYAKLKDKR